ncbi:unnamed protein product [Linum tenue]|uniref:Cupin type-1 domain-containing protein n=1 Tax=Linum tenue TaxID=586396 RepID=A0AAV0PKU9_9ROSI|nr:unnamed protein product [Linum tenue]
MARSSPSLLCLSLCLSALLFHASQARQQWQQGNECQLDRIDAIEPDNRIQSEAGTIETWNPSHQQFQCAGVAIVRRTIEPNGLLLPSYSNTPQLIYIVQDWHWNLNANSIIYAIRGQARVQIVNENGNSVFDGELREGQVLTVPQNFAVVKRCESDRFEWVSFKTNDNAMVNSIAGRTSAIRAIPADVLANAWRVSPEEARKLKFNRQETHLASSRSQSFRAAAA